MKNYIRNKYDVYNKIIKVIDSCKTFEHCLTAETMVDNYFKVYNDDLLYNILQDEVNNKYDKVLYNH